MEEPPIHLGMDEAVAALVDLLMRAVGHQLRHDPPYRVCGNFRRYRPNEKTDQLRLSYR